MTSTDTMLDNETPALPAPQTGDGATPSRRRQRESSRPAPTNDRVPALAALDAADDYVLVTRQDGILRVFSEGRLTVLESGGAPIATDALAAAAALLPFVVVDGSEEGSVAPAPTFEARRDEPGEDDGVDDETIPASAVPAALQTVAPVAAGTAFDPFAFFEPEDPRALGETDRVPGLSRGSDPVSERTAPDLSDGPFTGVALVIPGGRRITAPDYVIIGRSPSDQGGPGPAPELVALSANLTDISRSHLELRGDGDLLLARDLGSMNGTVLARAGQPPQLVPTDAPIVVLPGDALILGGSATVEVEGTR